MAFFKVMPLEVLRDLEFPKFLVLLVEGILGIVVPIYLYRIRLEKLTQNLSVK